jgi:hypothetical protein
VLDFMNDAAQDLLPSRMVCSATMMGQPHHPRSEPSGSVAVPVVSMEWPACGMRRGDQET